MRGVVAHHKSEYPKLEFRIYAEPLPGTRVYTYQYLKTLGFIDKKRFGSFKPIIVADIAEYVHNECQQWGVDNFAFSQQQHKSMEHGVIKYDYPDHRCPEYLLDYATSCFMQEYGHSVIGHRPYDIGDTPYVPDTSGGYKFHLGEVSTKKQAYRQYPKEYQWLLNQWQKKSYKVDDKDRPIVLWNCVIKYEVLKLQKILDEEERLFQAGPADCDLVSGAYTCDFDMRIKSQWISKPIKNGMTKFYGGLNYIAQYLNTVKDGEFSEGDGKNFDTTVTKQYLERCRDIRIMTLHPAYQTEKHINVLNNYYLEMVHSRMIMHNGQVVEKATGVPSGARTTAIDDSIVNYLARAVTYAKAYELKYGEMPTVNMFIDSIKYCLCGDDELDKHIIRDECDARKTGHILKEYANLNYPADRVTTSNTLEGRSFVGVTFTWSQRDHLWVGKPAYPGKILTSWYIRERVLTQEEELGLHISLLIETFWDKPLYQKIKKYTLDHFSTTAKAVVYVEDLPKHFLEKIPSDEEIRGLWVGFENKTNLKTFADQAARLRAHFDYWSSGGCVLDAQQ